MKKLLLTLLLCATATAANYYVATTGSDSADGSIGTPFLTITKGQSVTVPGDVVTINAGTYNEHVAFTRGGSVGLPTRYVASGAVVMRAARLQDPYIQLEGITFTGANNSWFGHIRIENDANNCLIKQCHIGPGVFVMADDMVFDDADDSITSASSNFVTAGFVAGQSIYVGACGLPGLYYANHDTSHTVATVAATKLTLSTPLVPETLTPAWAPVFAGPNKTGISGILWIISGGVGADSTRVTECVFDGVWGSTMDMVGTNHEIDHNTFTHTHSYSGLRVEASNVSIHDNLFIDCDNVIFFTQAEGHLLTHPLGSGWYDYQGGFIHSNVGSNNEFYNNWIENLEGPPGQISQQPGSSGFSLHDNVWVGVSGAGSNGRDGLSFQNNTFYRCAYNYPEVRVMAVGGNSAAAKVDGVQINENVFADCGSHYKTNEGHYGAIVNATNSSADSNFITGFETSGWAPRTDVNEANGINGGDPVFFDPELPRGVDGLPFTEDDGLRPLPSSPFAAAGWGGLAAKAVVVGTPFAHFRITSLTSGLGYKDAVGYDYDPTWLALTPYERTTGVRPFGTKEALGFPPVAVGFSASKSVGGLTSGSVDPTGITNFSWNFGDGTSVVNTASTEVLHTFTTSGSKTVTLTVTNSAAGTAVYDNTYRVLGTTPPAVDNALHVEKTGNDTTGDGSVATPWLTIQKAVSSVAAGAIVRVGPGVYSETIETSAAASGTDPDRITFDGQDVAQIAVRLVCKKPYWTWKNFKVSGLTGTGLSLVEIAVNAHYTIIDHCVIDATGTLQRDGLAWTFSGSAGETFPTNVASNCQVTNNEMIGVKGHTALVIGGSNNLIQGNNLHDLIQADCVRLFGDGNHIIGNTFRRNMMAPPGTISFHIDFIQTFNATGVGSKNHVIENNLIDTIEGQITQFEDNQLFGPTVMGSWLFCNNIFANTMLGCNISIPNMKFYNNVFYRCAYSGGMVQNFGKGTKGSADGAELLNNVYLDCGTITNWENGWYGDGSVVQTVAYTADYNYVGKNNFAPVRTAAARARFRWKEDNGINGGKPGFVDQAANNFRLVADSILIAQGLQSNALFTTDYLGTTRGAAWDIGPIEYDADYDYDDPPDDPPPPPPPPDNFPPTAPSAPAVTAASFARIDLTWVDESVEEVGFHIYRSLTTGTGFVLIGTAASNATQFADFGVAPSTEYFYKFSAFNAFGDSDNTSEVNATTFAPPGVGRGAGARSLLLK